MPKHLKETVFEEIEQRWAIDPWCWLALPYQYFRFHQAEIASWPAHEVMSEFKRRISKFWLGIVITWDHKEALKELKKIYQHIRHTQRVKLRVRSIIDPLTDKQTWQLTLKEKFESKKWFKRYKEHDIAISHSLAEDMIRRVSPSGGVRKNRYNIPWPDGKVWDVDQILGNDNYIDELDSQLMLWEIEVSSIDEHFEIPEWAIHQINGKREFKAFWTAQLQETPWSKMDPVIKSKYLELFENTQKRALAQVA